MRSSPKIRNINLSSESISNIVTRSIKRFWNLIERDNTLLKISLVTSVTLKT